MRDFLKGGNVCYFLRYFATRSGWDNITYWVRRVTAHGLGQIDGSGELQSPITNCACVIGKFSLISGTVHFDVNWIFKATELTDIFMWLEKALKVFQM